MAEDVFDNYLCVIKGYWNFMIDMICGFGLCTKIKFPLDKTKNSFIIYID